MSTTPKLRFIILDITTRIATFTDRNCTSLSVIIIIVTRGHNATIHNIILPIFTKLISVYLLSFGYFSQFRKRFFFSLQIIVLRNKPNVRISQCLECSSSTLQESDVWEYGAYPVYGANGVVGFLDNYNTSNEAIYIIKDGSGVGAVSYVAGKCSATGTLNIFNFEPYKTGMAIPHIYFKDYGKAQIFCPSYSEQLKYAKFLATIDDKLLTEQNVLINLSLQKQYLLRQMFIWTFDEADTAFE